MGSNFEWQKHQVNERIESAMGEAHSHRVANQNAAKRGFSLFSIFKGLFTSSKDSMPVIHKTEIPDTSHAEHLIDY